MQGEDEKMDLSKKPSFNLFGSQDFFGAGGDSTKEDDVGPKMNRNEDEDEDDFEEEFRYRHQCRPNFVWQLGELLDGKPNKEDILKCFKKTGFSDILRIDEFTGGINSKFVIWVVDNFEAE